MRFVTAVLLTLLLIGCNEQEIGSSRDADPESIYFDYLISGEEGSEDVVARLQFKFGGANGTTLLLEEPSLVKLDGEKLVADSARFTGVYYEVSKPLSGFKGKHLIEFVDRNQKVYKEEFEFVPFGFHTELPGKIKRAPFFISLKDFPLRETKVHLVMTDTAFNTNWINKEVNVEGAKLKITNEMLSRLKNGPITIELYREERRRVKDRTKEGGRITMRYSLKREFELVN